MDHTSLLSALNAGNNFGNLTVKELAEKSAELGKEDTDEKGDQKPGASILSGMVEQYAQGFADQRLLLIVKIRIGVRRNVIPVEVQLTDLGIGVLKEVL
jgi:hypothetical protein